jgi:hypothetical protein
MSKMIEMELFGATVQVEDNRPPQRKKRFKPHMLVSAKYCPDVLLEDRKNWLRVAEGLGIKEEQITREVAEALLKGHNQYAQKKAKAA